MLSTSYPFAAAGGSALYPLVASDIDSEASSRRSSSASTAGMDRTGRNGFGASEGSEGGKFFLSKQLILFLSFFLFAGGSLM